MGEHPTEHQPSEFRNVDHLVGERRPSCDHVDDGSPDHARDERHDEGKETRGARRSPCDEQKPNRECDAHRADVTSEVNRRLDLAAEHENRDGDRELEHCDNRQREPQPPISRRRCRPLFVDRGHDAVGEVGQLGDRPDAQRSSKTLRFTGVVTARAAGGEVRFDGDEVDPGVLVIERGRHGSSNSSAIHTRESPSAHQKFRDSVASLDDLTRLLLLAGQGDERSFAAAVRRSQGETWRVVRHLVGLDDADDVTQDAYVRAWRAAPRFRGDSSGRTWLLTIARRASADAIRRNVRRRRLEARVSRESVRGEQSTPPIVVDEMLESLPIDRREAFVLTQVVGCTYAEAASVCGVPVGTIRSRVARARTQLLATWHAAESS